MSSACSLVLHTVVKILITYEMYQDAKEAQHEDKTTQNDFFRNESGFEFDSLCHFCSLVHTACLLSWLITFK